MMVWMVGIDSRMGYDQLWSKTECSGVYWVCCWKQWGETNDADYIVRFATKTMGIGGIHVVTEVPTVRPVLT